MENQNYVDVMGSGTGVGAAPYITSLLAQGSTIPNYHGAFPGSSEGSYIAVISGDTYGASNGTTGIGDSSTKTIVDLFEAANKNWQAFREDSNGRGGDHFPFLDFNSIVNNSSRMTRVHSGASPTDLINAIKSGPGFYWFTPSDNHNMHDNSVSSGDSYLRSFVPQILSSPAFVNGTGLLILWWDEYDPAPIVLIGNIIKKGYISPNNNYDHYSTLKFIETLWGLSTLTSNDAAASSMPDLTTSTPPPPPPTLTYRLEAPPGTIIIQNQSLSACQAAINSLPALIKWQIFDSNNVLVSSGTTPSTPPPPPGSTKPPILYGWGGIFADSADLQTNLDVLKSRGYNCFRCMIYNADFGRYCSISSIVNAVNVAKSNNLWIILDYHGFTQSFDTDPFWDQVIAAVSGLYNNIVYEPCNEPIQSVSTLSTMYQNWVDKLRATGDTHWFIISPGQQTVVSSGNPLPTLNDPLNQIINSWHEYYFYQYHSTWTLADADAFADSIAAPAQGLISQGQMVILTEFGADPGAGGGSSGTPPPDLIVGGSAGYAPESLEYTKRLIEDLTQMGAGYMLWTADNWTNTPGAGATGALNVWGQLVPTPSSNPPPPPPPPSGGLTPPTTGIIQSANMFQSISGTLSGNTDGSISISTTRLRAIANTPINTGTATIDFLIHGPTATTRADVDGITRSGVTIFTNVLDQCNQYFITWRNHSDQPAGTSTIAAHLVFNPGLTTLAQCPGTGFSLLTDKATGGIAEKVLNINIMDGSQHSLSAVRIGASSFQIFADGVFIFEAVDSSNTLPDNQMLGLRTDNVIVDLFYSTTSTTLPPPPTPTPTGDYNLSFEGFDWDGGNEETIRLNGRLLARLPTTNDPANEQVYMPFTVTIPSTMLNFSGSNTLRFTHAQWDCGVDDNVKNLLITDPNGSVIFSDPTDRVLNCTTPIVYVFGIGIIPPSPTPLTVSFSVSSIFTANISGGAQPYTITWDFGDSTSGNGTPITHIYQSPGTYIVNMSVVDSLGQTTGSTKTIVIN